MAPIVPAAATLPASFKAPTAPFPNVLFQFPFPNLVLAVFFMLLHVPVAVAPASAPTFPKMLLLFVPLSSFCGVGSGCVAAYSFAF